MSLLALIKLCFVPSFSRVVALSILFGDSCACVLVFSASVLLSITQTRPSSVPLPTSATSSRPTPLTARRVIAPMLFAGIWPAVFGGAPDAEVDLETMFAMHVEFIMKALSPAGAPR